VPEKLYVEVSEAACNAPFNDLTALRRI